MQLRARVMPGDGAVVDWTSIYNTALVSQPQGHLFDEPLWLPYLIQVRIWRLPRTRPQTRRLYNQPNAIY